MSLTVLSDHDVRKLLLSLAKEDILELQQSLADALHYYSTATEAEANGCCASYQPMRTALKRNDGQTTLFMPASSNDGLGVKIVTLAVPSEGKGKDSVSESTTSIDSLSLSSSTDQQSSSASLTDAPPESIASSSRSTTPKGSITLLDKNGAPRAFINAEEITAFRTALASTILFKKRKDVHELLVFGAGKQAYWHIRLALLLRGEEIHHLNIVNRSFETGASLIRSLFSVNTEDPLSPLPTVPIPRPKVSIITPAHGEYDRLLKSAVRGASAIFCTTPSLTPLFPASHLTNTDGRKKGRYIAAIGSYKPHMIEIHPDIIRQAVAPHHGHHFHKHAQEGGAIVVDSVTACLKEAGELIQAKVGGREVVELGELVMLKRDAERRRKERNGEDTDLDSSGVELGDPKKTRKSQDGDKEDEAHKSLVAWLHKGNVIFKSVGLGLMDVVVGGDLVTRANEKGIGTMIPNF